MQPASDDCGHHGQQRTSVHARGSSWRWGQQRGLDAASKSAITGFITKEDDIGTVESPFGKVQLVQLIGVKAEEIEQMKNKTMTPAQLAEILKDGLTDYKR